MLNVSFIISDHSHPVFDFVENWAFNQSLYNIEIVAKASDLRESGDFLFLISCSEIIPLELRNRFTHCLVLHASDLPKGRGWSPHVWDILSGSNTLVLSLLEAEDRVDTGRIWLKKTIPLDGSELYEEINQKLFAAEIELIEMALTQTATITPTPQEKLRNIHYYPKRTAADSELDINKTIIEQFNLIRVSDSERFPAFVNINGQKYTVTLKKIQNEK